MNKNSIGLLLALVAIVALGYAIMGGGPSLPTQAIEPGGLEPGGARKADTAPLPSGLAAPIADLEGETGRKEISRSQSKQEKLAASKADQESKKAEGPSFTGTVFGNDGMPIPNVEVTVKGEFGAAGAILGAALKIAEETTTDRSGNFRVPRGRWPLQELSVELKGRGFLVVRELRAPDTNSGDGSLGDFVVKRGVVLAGKVVDSEGNAVADATVRRTSVDDDGTMDGMVRIASTFGRRNDSQCKSDSDGLFELLHEESGSYLLVVDQEDYPQLRHRGEAPLVGGESLGLVLRMPPAATISGKILGYPEGRRGVMVKAKLVEENASDSATLAGTLGSIGIDNDQGCKVSESGEFEIKGLMVGRKYEVRASVQAGLMSRTACTELEEVSSGARGVELKWKPGGRVSFDVKDKATGEPLRGLVVRHRWADQSRSWMGRMAKKVEFKGSQTTIEDLRPASAPGELQLSVWSEGYLEETRDGIEVTEARPVDLGTIYLRLAPRVRVQVVDTATGEAVRKARVVLTPQDDSESSTAGMNSEQAVARTDRDGWCELPACATELGTLTVKKGGYATFERVDVRMPKEGDSEEIVRLFTGGRIQISVIDAEGMPAANVGVSHRLPDESTKRHQTNSKGTVTLNDLEAGDHSFLATRDTGGRGRGRRRNRGAGASSGSAEDSKEWKVVLLTDGAESGVELQLPPVATIEGIVLLRGQPVSQARVMLYEGEESKASDELSSRMRERMSSMMPDSPSGSRTDSQGRFSLNDAPLGNHRIRVAPEDGAPAHYAPVSLRAGLNRVEVDMPSAAVEGRVIDSEGNPVAGASVETLQAPDESDAGEMARIEMAMSFFGGNRSYGLQTDYNGEFLIEGVPTETPLVVRVQAAGYSGGQSEQFEVDDRELKRGIEVVLNPSGSIRIVSGDNVASFQPVSAEFEDDSEKKPSPKMAFLQGGSAVIRGLKPGKWKVYLNSDKENYELAEVHAGEQTEVLLGP